MSSVPNSSSSLTGSTLNPTDGSGRKITSSFAGPFGFGSPRGLYDHEGNFYAVNSDATHKSRISVSGLGATPTLVTASSQAPSIVSGLGATPALVTASYKAPSVMAGGGSVSRALSSSGGTQTTRSVSTEQNRMMSGVQGFPQVFPSSYFIAGGQSQNQVERMNSLSSMSFMNDKYPPPFKFGDIPTDLGLSSMYQPNQESNIENEDFPELTALPGYTDMYGSVSRALSSDGGIPTTTSESNELNRMMSGVQGSPQVFPMPGSSYPIAEGQSQNQVQGMNSLSSMSFMNDKYTLPFKFGDIPTDLGLSSMYQLNQESIIQDEDFPALSGYTGINADYQMDLHHHVLMMQSQQPSMGKLGEYNFGGASTSHYPQQHAQAVSSGAISSQTGGTPTSVNVPMGYNQPLVFHRNTSHSRGQKLSAIGQPFKPRQETAQPKPDPYSMLGLLSVIKNTNPDATTLAIGMDLTELGLDMTSKKSLFKTFATPWADEPLEDDHDEFTIPQCYNARQNPPPSEGRYRKFTLKTLFYIFYSMPQDEEQLYAANELYNRGWFYYKVPNGWYLRIGEPLLETHMYETGTYDCFDPNIFESVRREHVYILYEMMEERPSLPQH